MSFTDFSVPEKGAFTLTDQPRFTDIHLNELFKQGLKNVQEKNRLANIVVRCENLPVIYGDHALISQMFSLCIETILEKGHSIPRLFLHLNCSEGKKKGDSNRIEYTIGIHTNLVVTADWKSRHRQTFALCQQILSLHEGCTLFQNRCYINGSLVRLQNI